MSTHSKKEKKMADKNSTTKSYTNKSEKLRGWDAIKNEPVGPYLRKMRKASKASAAKRKRDMLKKEQAGYHLDKPLRDVPVGVGMRQLLNKKPKLDQIKMKNQIKKSREAQKKKQNAKRKKSSVTG